MEATFGPTPRGVFIRRRHLFLMVLFFVALLLLQVKTLFDDASTKRQNDTTFAKQVSSSDRSPVYLRNPLQQEQCRFYLAESAIPNGGLGIFAGVGLLKGDKVGFPDICIFVSNPPRKWTHLRSHTFGRSTFFGQYEGSHSRAACEGLGTLPNTMPNSHINTKLLSPVQPTHATVTRDTPGAGALTHHFGLHGEAIDLVPAGYEITIDYGDWDFDPKLAYTKPRHTVEYLQEKGWCIDNMEVRIATDPSMGRGAFAKRSLPEGTIVAPAPLQCFDDRALFQITQPEQLYVNYCLQPSNSKLLFYPYGPGVNLINHSKEHSNVEFRWSTSHMHHAEWLQLDLEQFWQVATPGGLILDIVATRDIQPGEELFLDYGSDWDAAWKKHLAEWIPPADAKTYKYPQDMDETEPLRTLDEQKRDPYPENLVLVCNTPDWKRESSRHIVWYEPEWEWSEGMVFCHIHERNKGRNGDDVYTVSLLFSDNVHSNPTLTYDDSIPWRKQYVDYSVPRSAIRWVEKPYYDDEHLPNAFRHPIGFPDQLLPSHWKTEL